MTSQSPASEHIKDTLVADGYSFGTGLDWSLYIGEQPDLPSRAVTIYDSAGSTPNPRWLLDYPHIQIRIRGGASDYVVASQKAMEIRNRLLGRPSYDAYNGSGDRIVAINAIGDVAFTGKDEQKRPEFVINFALIVEPVASDGSNRDPL